MAEPVTTPPPADVAGLLIPADLATQIIAAFRAIYPTLTEDKADDEAAVRAVLIWFITSTLETHATRQAYEALDATIAQLRAKADVAAQQRRAAIHAAAKRIQEKPPIPSEEPTP